MKNARWITAVIVCCGAWLTATSQAQSTMDVDREFEFASGLIELGFPDLANRVVSQVLRLHPDQKDRATRIQGEILISQRRFADAEKILEEMPAGHAQRYALQLRIANGYFRINEVEKAQKLYEDFFNVYRDEKPTDPDLLRFYQDAAYQYGQMMERMGRRETAVQSYRRLIDAGMDDAGAMRRLQVDVARLYLQLGRDATGSERDAYLKQAFEMCEAVQWGGYDIWFGQSIGLMANVELARGNEAAARDLLQRYMNDLNRIDEILRKENVPSSASPVASARFLLGELHEKNFNALRERNAPEAEIIQAAGGALTEYFNVFAKYSGSDWSGEASTRGRAIIAILETDYGRKVNIDFGENIAEAAQAQFNHADDLFRQRNYAKAIEEYLRILNAFPEGAPSIRALANVLMSYTHLGDELHVQMMADYFAERFAGQEIMGSALLMASREFVTKKNERMYELLFDYFFKGFPKHERTPQLLFDMARRREAVGDREAALAYYNQIVENHPRDRFFLRAVFAMAIGAHQREDYDRAVELFARYVEESPPGHDRVRAQFLMADAQQRQNNYAEAIQAYGQVVRWLSAERAPDNANPDDVEKNENLMERSLFFVGFCFARITEPAAQVETFRQRGLATYDQFLRRYPRSSLAPTAMRDKGAIQLSLGQSEAAAETFEQLAREYPDSEEGRSALFALVSSAFEIGKPEIARDAFRRMITTPDAYRPEEFTRIGQLMLDNGLYEDVIPAYQRVVETTDQRSMLELALYGLGYAHNHQGNHDEAARHLADLLERFPNTAYFYEAKFIQSRSSLALERYDVAQSALSDILRLSSDNVLNQRAQFDLAKVQAASGDPRAALASFQRIALLQDPRDTRLRPIIEESLVESLKLMLELKLYPDVEDVSVQFLSDFPQSQQVDEVRRMRAEARRLAAQSGM